MLVSIVIPIYNVAPYIERCLFSVLNQSYQDLEILLINDCTQDNSMDIVSAILEKHSRAGQVTILNHELNKGLSGARNTGILAANGDYLYFLDSDDYISTDCISLLVYSALANDSQMVIGDISVEGEGSFNKWFNFKELPECINSNSEIRDYYYTCKLYMMAWNKLIKRTFILENSLFFYEGIIHEDDHWSFFVFRKLQSLSIVDIETYVYCLRGDSIMSDSNKVRSLESRLKIANSFFNNLDRSFDASDKNYISTFAFNVIRECFSNPKYKYLFDTFNSRMNICKYVFFKSNIKSKIKFVFCLLPSNVNALIFSSRTKLD